MAKKKKKRGRPKGSRNRVFNDVPATTRILPNCFRCGAVGTLRVLRKVREQNHRGLSIEGLPYNKVTWRRMECSNCSGVQMDRELSFDENGGVPRKKKSNDS